MLPSHASSPRIAYFSLEIGFRSDIPIYSGGLGVLAGDTLKFAADFGLPIVVVSLLHRRGYFKQSLDLDGWQSESPIEWDFVEKGLQQLPNRVKLTLEGREVQLQARRYDLAGEEGHSVPLYFLDSDLPKNHEISAPNCCFATSNACPKSRAASCRSFTRAKRISKTARAKRTFTASSRQRVLEGSETPVVFLENYDMDLALKIIAGSDLWLNTSLRPREASGRSDMKITHNGAPNFSILGGWWIEGHVAGVTGGASGRPRPKPISMSATFTPSWKPRFCRLTTPTTRTKVGSR